MGRLYDAYVEVGPRFSGFGEIKKQGAQAGTAYGKALTDAAEKAAKANVRRLGEALAKARSTEADAIGSVRVAETKLSAARGASETAAGKAKTAEKALADIRANGGSAKATERAELALRQARDGEAASLSKVAAAEESLATAQRKSATASNTAKDAAESLKKAQKEVADAADSAGKAGGGRFSRAFKNAASKIGGDKEGKQFATRFGVGMNGAIGGIVSRSAGIFAVGFAAIKTADVFKEFITGAKEGARTDRITEQAIRSTGGAAKITATQLTDLAHVISRKTGVDDAAIQSGQNLLLTFTNIRNEAGKGNDIFNQASQSITDMTAAMNNGVVTSDGLKTSSIQVGKALNDPIKGVTALQKVGVSFTEGQKKQIKSLVASGKTMQAQKIILGELSKEFGGAAEAAADPWEKFKVRFGQAFEPLEPIALKTIDVIGNAFLKATPYVEKFAGFLAGKAAPAISGLTSLLLKGDFTSAFRKAFNVEEDSGLVAFFLGVHDAAASTFGFFKSEVLPRLKDFAAFTIGTVVPAVAGLVTNLVQSLKPAVTSVFGFFKTDVIPRLQEFAGFIGDKILPKLSSLAESLSKNKDFLVPFVGTLVGIVGGLKAWAVIQAILNAELFANPIGLVVLAIAALVGGIVYAYKHSETFRDVVKAAFDTVKNAVTTAVTIVTATVKALVVGFNAVKDAAVAVGSFMASVWSAIVNAVKTAVGAVGTALGAVGAAFTAAVNFVKSVWSSIIAAVSGPVNAVISVLQAIWSRISPILVLPFYIAKSVITSTFAGIQVVFSTVAGWVKSVFAKAWSAVSGVLSGPINTAKNGIVKTWAAITNGFTLAKNFVVTVFSKAWSAVKGVITGPINAAKTWLDKKWTDIRIGFTYLKDWATGAFSKGWAAIKDKLTAPVSLALGTIKTLLSGAKGGLRWVFSQAVTAVGAIWKGLQALAKAPIKFIVNTVLNGGLIAGFNWIADKFKAPTIKPIPLPKGFADGGRIPGMPSDVDNTLGFHKGGAIPLATGEFIVNARQTAKNLPLLEAINSGDGYANGGLFGSLKNAVGGAFNAGKNLVGDVADFTKDASGWLKKKFSGPLGKLSQLGNSPIAQIVSAVPKSLADTLVGQAKDLLKGLVVGGGGVGPNTPAGKVVRFRGELLNQRTIAMLLSAEAALRKTFHIMQGSYSTRVAASGSTHAGGGAMDTDNAGAGWDTAVRALRAVGFAAWHRTPAMGPWGHHIHSIAIGDPTASPAAKNQVKDFLRGGDGLGGRSGGGLVGSYAEGAWRLPHDQLAMVHKGEMVVPADAAEVLRGFLPALGGKVRNRLHLLHVEHLAHQAHVAHLAHVNRVGHGFFSRSRLKSLAAGADVTPNGVTSGDQVVKLHPDSVRDVAVAFAGIQLNIDSRSLDTALSRSAIGRGF